MPTVLQGFLVVVSCIVKVFFTTRYVRKSCVNTNRDLSDDSRWVARSCMYVQWSVVGLFVGSVVFSWQSKGDVKEVDLVHVFLDGYFQAKRSSEYFSYFLLKFL